MCGIVGLFLKDKTLEPKLGEMLTEMLITMTDRGPDSAGIAVYGDEKPGRAKLTVQAADPDVTFSGLEEQLHERLGLDLRVWIKDTHAVIDLPVQPVILRAGPARCV